jgi:homoserine kinase type II
MAVYTPVSEDELGTFLAEYDIGETKAFSGITEGVENTNYRLTTTKGDFILTLYEKRVDPEDLPFFIGLMGHLAENGIACPVPIADTSGEVLKTLNGRSAAIVSFLKGGSNNKPSPERCGAAGSALAGMHLAASGFTGTRKNALSSASWTPLLAESANGKGHFDPELINNTAERLDEILQDWPQDLPTGIIHADLFPDNVLFTGDDVTGLIDFYFACEDMLAYDLAVMLNAWCYESDFSINVTKARRLVAGYQSVRPLSDQERAALPVLCRGAAMRFFLTRLYDWINTPKDAQVRPHDPMVYWKRLNFHFNTTSPSVYGAD